MQIRAHEIQSIVTALLSVYICIVGQEEMSTNEVDHSLLW